MAEESNTSLGKKIWSFFIADETAVTPEKTGSLPKEEPSSVVADSINHSAGAVDEKFIDHFVNLLEKANLQGPDYFEYRETLKNLEGLGLSEDKRYQAAWASFKAMSNSTDYSVLTNTANQYVTMLDTDRQHFLKDVENAITEKVGGLKNEVLRMQQENEAIAKQILALQQKVEANKTQITKLTGDIGEQSAKITTNKNNYEVTYSSFVEQIKSDISKIQQYIANQ